MSNKGANEGEVNKGYDHFVITAPNGAVREDVNESFFEAIL
ncbi:MAG: hypothetical protein ABIJ52_12925 [Pseudomonadota bacterium]